MGRFKHGWKPDKLDPRDLLYRKIAKPRTEPLPDSVDLRLMCSPIEDQGALGSCTANALVGALEFLELKAQRWFMDYSRLFLYFNEREIEGNVGEDAGAELRDGVKSLNQDGICPEIDWPYNIKYFTTQPDAACYLAAKTNRIQSYHRLLNLNEMLACLAEGFPFVFGFTVFSSFESIEVAKSGVVQMPERGEQNLGGHAVMAVGYDRATRRFIVRNSWGSDWGQAGYFTIPFDYVEYLADDFWTVRS